MAIGELGLLSGLAGCGRLWILVGVWAAQRWVTTAGLMCEATALWVLARRASLHVWVCRGPGS